MAAANSPAAHVQHVTKASSEQLLCKFAELGQGSAAARSTSKLQMIVKGPTRTRNKRSRRVASGLGARDVGYGAGDVAAVAAVKRRRSAGSAAECNKSLLPTTAGVRRSSGSGAMVRRMGIGKAERGTAALLAALERTWRRTVEGASKMFIEKHCSTHVRLISDVV